MFYPTPAGFSKKNKKKYKEKIKKLKKKIKSRKEAELEKLKKVDFTQPSTIYERVINDRRDDYYYRAATYLLILHIRDVLYSGKNPYHLHNKKKAIHWFKTKNIMHPFGYGTICLMMDISPERLWVQIRRWIKVDPEKLSSSLKGAESSVFDGPKLSNMRRNRNAVRIGEKNRSKSR